MSEPLAIADLDYHLPEELIAQQPARGRDAARLLVVERRTGVLAHETVAALPRTLLRPGDLLVVNDTRVIPARVRGQRPTGGRIELLLVRPAGDDRWDALLRGHPHPGERLLLPDGAAICEEDLGGGCWRLRFVLDEPFDAWLARVGETPLPPYIRRPDGPTAADAERYQTVFATRPGAIAAPTAGLHFTSELLARLAEQGVAHAAITLHVGPGTFLPIRDGALAGYTMEPERYEIPADAVAAIDATRARGGRVVAVGTTTVRALESAASAGTLRAGAGEAALFIRPGHAFRAIDALVTNFHLPRTPLLALVAAFAGWDRLRDAYATAVRERYRFYSFGDAMLIR